MDAGGTVAACGVGLMSQKVMITRVATVLLMAWPDRLQHREGLVRRQGRGRRRRPAG
jgi:hypothetical protein